MNWFEITHYAADLDMQPHAVGIRLTEVESVMAGPDDGDGDYRHIRVTFKSTYELNLTVSPDEFAELMKALSLVTTE